MTKNITLSADAKLIEQARNKAAAEHRSLNALFRQWLSRYVGQESASTDYERLMDELSYAAAGQRFTRDELNER